MSKLIHCPEKLPEKKDYWIFLMGPIQGAPEWQDSVLEFPGLEDVTFLSPRRIKNPKGSEDEKKVFSDEDYQKQVDWETQGLRYCDAILCWIPKPAEVIEGRSYAQTTRFELGENLARGKKVWIGCDPEISGRRYFQQKATQYGQGIVFDTLGDCIEEIKRVVSFKKSNPTTFFTSDTHFGATRTFELSKRPFLSVKDMDTRMIENWNREVSPWDSIYHLGDFGNQEMVKYLNGRKTLVLGNYEREEKNQSGLDMIDYTSQLKENGWDHIVTQWEELNLGDKYPEFILSHKPLFCKQVVMEQRASSADNFGIFGHIHGRQPVKPWGYDVGVDANNFCPVSLEKVMFIYNAIKNGHYDEEVWS